MPLSLGITLLSPNRVAMCEAGIDKPVVAGCVRTVDGTSSVNGRSDHDDYKRAKRATDRPTGTGSDNYDDDRYNYYEQYPRG